MASSSNAAPNVTASDATSIPPPIPNAIPVSVALPENATSVCVQKVIDHCRNASTMPSITIGNMEIDLSSYLPQSVEPASSHAVPSEISAPAPEVNQPEKKAEETESPLAAAMSEDSDPMPLAKAAKKSRGKRKRNTAKPTWRSGRFARRVDYSESLKKKKLTEGDSSKPIQVFGSDSSSEDTSMGEPDTNPSSKDERMEQPSKGEDTQEEEQGNTSSENKETEEKENTNENDDEETEKEPTEEDEAEKEANSSESREEEVPQAETESDSSLKETLSTFLRKKEARTKKKADVAPDVETSNTTSGNHSNSSTSIDESNDEIYYDETSEKVKTIRKRRFFPERSIDLFEFSNMNLVPFLEERKLLKALQYAGAYISDWIYEWYANLKKKYSRRSSGFYGHFMFRGTRVDFTPTLINDFLEMDDVEEQPTPELDVICEAITGGRIRKWHNKLQAASMTSLYSILHKLIVYNWLPSSNTTKVTIEQARLLYRIVVMKNVNLGLTIFNNMMKYAGDISEKGYLPYPVLIYNFLRDKEFERRSSEVLSSGLHNVGISHVYLTGNRVVDLPLAEPEAPSVPPTPHAETDQQNAALVPPVAADIPSHTAQPNVAHSVGNIQVDTVNISVPFIHTQLRHLQDSINELQFLKSYWEDLLLSATSGGVPDPPPTAGHNVVLEEMEEMDHAAAAAGPAAEDVAADVLTSLATSAAQTEPGQHSAHMARIDADEDEEMEEMEDLDVLYGDLPDLPRP